MAAVISAERKYLRVLEAPRTAVRQRLDHLKLQLESLAATAGRPLGGEAFLRRSAEGMLRELHTMLLEPILRGMPSGGTLTIVPHDILHRVPFECLHDEHMYLDRSWQIARCPTADFLIDRRTRVVERDFTDNNVVIAGNRAGTPFIEEEARRVLQCWGSDGGRLLIDPTPEAALGAIRTCRILHLSAHGSFRADNPLFSTLHLGENVIFLADILETPLGAELAVLSACNSGQTFSGRGDALLGVAHAFLAAGARRLVASLWRVHDEATAEWMEIFHRTYRQSKDPVAARSAASQELRGRRAHPFYWGGFCVMGD